MGWGDVRLRVPLDSRPLLAQAAVAVHGIESKRERSYRFPGWWVFHIYRHAGEVRMRGETFPIRPGYASLIPPGEETRYRFVGRCEHTYCFFKLPRRRAARVQSVAAMQDLGRSFLDAERDLRDVVRWFPTEPRRAEVRLWDLLWRMVDEGAESPATAAVDSAGLPQVAAMHPALRRAVELIELRLQERLTVAELARAVGLSHAHLVRLFRAELGSTVVAYIRRRRVRRARYLLAQSTLPIKAVAAEVGIPDLHLFNKTVRRELGRAPRDIRADPHAKPVPFLPAKP